MRLQQDCQYDNRPFFLLRRQAWVMLVDQSRDLSAMQAVVIQCRQIVRLNTLYCNLVSVLTTGYLSY